MRKSELEGLTRAPAKIVMWHTKDGIRTTLDSPRSSASPEWHKILCWFRLLVEPMTNEWPMTNESPITTGKFHLETRARSDCGVSCVQRQNAVKIVRKWKRDRIFWNLVQNCRDDTGCITCDTALATGRNTKCTFLSAVPQCSFFTSPLYTSLCLGEIYDFRNTSKTTLIHWIFFLKAVVIHY